MKVGITFAPFNLFHAGHVKIYKESKRQCYYLYIFNVLNCSSIKSNLLLLITLNQDLLNHH